MSTPAVPAVLGRLEVAGHRDLARRCGGHGGVAGLAGQPAAYHRQGLAAVRAEHVQDIEAALVVQLPAGYQELVGVPAGGGGGAARGHRVDGQEVVDRLGGPRARGGLLLGGGVRLHAILEAAELPSAHEDAERDGQHDEEVDPPPSRGQQEPVHPSTVRSPLRSPGAGCRVGRARGADGVGGSVLDRRKGSRQPVAVVSRGIRAGGGRRSYSPDRLEEAGALPVARWRWAKSSSSRNCLIRSSTTSEPCPASYR